jgi:hypothetical protein
MNGVNKNVITGKRYEDHLQDAGFKTEVIQNQGIGAGPSLGAACSDRPKRV